MDERLRRNPDMVAHHDGPRDQREIRVVKIMCASAEMRALRNDALAAKGDGRLRINDRLRANAGSLLQLEVPGHFYFRERMHKGVTMYLRAKKL